MAKATSFSHFTIKSSVHTIKPQIWEDDERNEVIENFEIQNLDELNVCLKKYALIAQASTKQDETIQEPTDTTMIDIYFKLIKDKLAEHQITLILKNKAKPKSWSFATSRISSPRLSNFCNN